LLVTLTFIEFHSGVTPLGGCHPGPGRSAPPPSDATDVAVSSSALHGPKMLGPARPGKTSARPGLARHDVADQRHWCRSCCRPICQSSNQN